MATIDERVVEMRFDNKDFEKNVQTSLKTLDKLKEELDFKDATKSLNELQNAAKHFSLDDIGNAVSQIADKLNWRNAFKIELLSTVINQVENIITSAMTRISSALHLDKVDWVSNLLEGWTKYGDKTQSVATIMAATGESIETVNAQMEKLMYFTDETSYSFTDMAGNIGKFTANGVDLETASQAMEGIATWAARSGQNAQTASRVMYNLSQAIGMGSLKLQDWKSVELANMGTQEFKEMAIQAGLEAKTLKKVGDQIVTVGKGTVVTVSNFRETLAEGWLNTEALVGEKGVLTEYGKAAELINQLHEVLGGTANDVMDLAERAGKGSLSVKELGKALGIQESELQANNEYINKVMDSLKLLSSEEYKLSLETYKAAQEARTFGDAMDAVADAVSSGWMRTFELIFGDYETAKHLWLDLADNLIDIFGAGVEARNELLESAASSGWDDLESAIVAAGGSLEDFDDALLQVAGGEKILGKLLGKYESVREAFQKGYFGDLGSDEVKGMVNEAIDNLHTLQGEAKGTAGYIGLTYEELDKYGQDIRAGMYGWYTSEEQIERLMAANEGLTKEQAETIVKYAEASHAVHRSLTEEEAQEFLVLSDIVDAQKTGVELTDAQREALKKYTEELDRKNAQKTFISALINSGHILVDVINIAREAFRDMFPPMTARQLSDMAAKFKEVTDKARLFLKEGNKGGIILKEVFHALLLPVRLVADVFGGLVQLIMPLGKLILAIVSPILGLASGIAKLVKGFDEGERQLDPFAKTINTITEALKVLIGFITEVVKYVGSFVQSKLLEKLAGPIETITKLISGFKKDKSKSFTEFIESIKAADPKAVGNRIINVLRQIYDFIKNFKIGEFAPFGERFKNFIASVSASEGIFSKVATKIKAFKDSIAETSGTTGVSKLSATLSLFKEKAIGVFETLKNRIFGTSEAGAVLREKFEGLIASVSEFKDKVIAKFKEIKDAITDLIQGKEVDFSQLFGNAKEFLPKVLKGGAIAAGIAALTKLVFGLKKAKDATTKGVTFEDVIESLNPFSDTIEKIKTALSGFNIVAFAAGMLILAYAFNVLSKIPAENIALSLGTLGLALAEFIGMLAAVNKVMGTKKIINFVGLGLGMMAIAGALLIFAKAVDVFKEIDFASNRQALKTIALLTVAVVALSALAKKAGKFNFKLSNGLGLMAAATAFLIFGKVLKSYTKLNLNSSNIKRVMAALVLAVASMGLISLIAGKSNFKLSNGLGMIAMAGSLYIFAGVVNKLGSMSDGVLRRGLTNMAMLAGIITVMTAIIGAVMGGSRFGSGVATVLTLISITVALTTLAATAALLGLVPPDKLANGTATLWKLAGLLTAMSSVVAILGSVTGIKKALAGVLLIGVVALALIAFSGIIAVLSVIGWGLIPGMFFLAIILGEMAFVMVAITKFVQAVNPKSAILAAVAIGLFGLALIPLVYTIKQLAEIDYSGTTEGMNLLTEMLAGFLAVVLVAFVVGQAAAAAGPIFLAGMAVVGILFAGFIYAIHQAITELERLADLDAEGIMASITAIDALIDEFIGIAGKFNDNGVTFSKGLETAAIMFAFGKGLYPLITDAELLGLVDAEKVEPGIGAVDALLDYMIGLRDKFINSGTNFGNALLSAANVFAFGVGLYPLANDVKILGLANATAAKEAIAPMEELLTLMINLATVIGADPDFFNNALTTAGSIVAFGAALLPLVGVEFISGLADAETVTANMGMISDMITQFFTLAEQVGNDSSLYEAAQGVAEVIKQFGGALAGLIIEEFISQFIDSKAAEDGFKGVEHIINFFINTAKQFVKDGEVDEAMFESAKQLAVACKQFGVALLFLTGSSFIQQFINAKASEEGFKPIETIVNFFIETAKLFDGGENGVSFDAAKDAAKACEEFGKALLWLAGGEVVMGLAKAASAEESFSVIKRMVGMFLMMAHSFNQNTSLFGSAKEAAEACKDFSAALAKLAKSENRVSKVQADQALKGLEAIGYTVTMLIDLAEKFASVEGLKTAAEDAAKAVEVFSGKMKSMASNLTDGLMGPNTWSNVDETKVKTVIDAIVGAMTQVANIQGLDSVDSSFSAINNFLGFINNMKTADMWGNQSFDASQFTKALDDIGTSTIKLADSIAKLDTTNLREFTNLLSILINNESLADALKTMRTFGNEIVLNVTNGMDESSATLYSIISALISGIITTLRNSHNSFEAAGRYCAIGFNNGMVSMQGTIMANAAKIGQSAANALRSYLGIRSPSRVFAEIGEYAVLGLAKGIEDSENSVVDSVYTLGDALVDAMQRAMNYAHNVDYGITPTITPVMDMSGVHGSASNISALLGSFDINGVLSRMDVDGATINNSIQSRDIINEIRLLNEQIAIMDEDIQNMQIILDTGVLVGSTSAMMDNQFGVMASRRGRGN